MPAPGASHRLKVDLVSTLSSSSFSISEGKGLKHLLQTNSFSLTASWLQASNTVYPATPPYPSLIYVISTLILPICDTFEWLRIFCPRFEAHIPPTQAGKIECAGRDFS